jgi:putative transposase
MTNYRRIFVAGATWFFTVNLARRDIQSMLVEHIEELRQAFRYVQQWRVFQIDAIVILPDHLHSIWTLPDGDSDYSTRWNLIKGHFSRHIARGETISASRQRKRERGIYPRAQVAAALMGTLNYRSKRFQPAYRLHPCQPA